MKNLEPIRKPINAQLDGSPKPSRREKTNKPVLSNQKRYQGEGYLSGDCWFNN